MGNIKLVATDLDGTFLRNDRSISAVNLEALHLLGSRNITRVVATGRNLHKVYEVIGRHVPFDFIVYSSGAGVYNWKEQRNIFTQNMNTESAGKLLDHFVSKKYSFCAFNAAPGNHILWYHKGVKECNEFNRYLTSHNAFAKPLPGNFTFNCQLSQFLLIIPEHEVTFSMLKSEIESVCSEIRVIRSSSPVTNGFIWVEVFHRQVSKGNGVKLICNITGINPEDTFGIGNDYNDLDLLEFTAFSYITDNAPKEIKGKFITAPSNEDDAFASAVGYLLS
jgi:Cof subfamily protein (haloacid dehalogenase superfamily)